MSSDNYLDVTYSVGDETFGSESRRFINDFSISKQAEAMNMESEKCPDYEDVDIEFTQLDHVDCLYVEPLKTNIDTLYSGLAPKSDREMYCMQSESSSLGNLLEEIDYTIAGLEYDSVPAYKSKPSFKFHNLSVKMARWRDWWMQNNLPKDYEPKRYCCCNYIFQSRIRTAIFVVLMLLLSIFFVIVIQGIIRAVMMSKSDLMMERFEVKDLCSRDIAFSISGKMINPSTAKASFDDTVATIATEHGLIGTTRIQGHTLFSGDSPIFLDTALVVQDTAALSKTIQDFVNGMDIQYSISVNLTVHTDVFLFPLTLSLPIEISDVYIQEERGSEPQAVIEKIAMMSVDDNMAELRASVNLKLANTSLLVLNIPELMFEFVVDDGVSAKVAGAGVTGNATYGTEGGKLDVTLNTLREHLSGSREVLRAITENHIRPISIRGKNVTGLASDDFSYPAERRALGCFAQTLLGNVEYTLPMYWASGKRTDTLNIAAAAAVKSSLVSIQGLNVVDIKDSFFSFKFDAFFGGLDKWYHFSGPISCISFDVFSVDLTENPMVITVQIVPFTISSDDPHVEVNVNFAMHNASALIGVANQYVSNMTTKVEIAASTDVSLLSDILAVLNREIFLPEMGSFNVSSNDKMKLVVDIKSNEVSMNGLLSIRFPDDYFNFNFDWNRLMVSFAFGNEQLGCVTLDSFNSLSTNVIEMTFDLHDQREGEVINEVISTFFLSEIVNFSLNASYNSQQFDSSLDLILMQSSYTPNVGSGIDAFSFISVKSLEFLTLNGDQIVCALVAQMITIIELHISLPALIVDIGTSKDDVWATIESDPVIITSKLSDFDFAFGIKVLNITEIAWNMLEFADGRNTTLSIMGNTDGNFMSTVLSGYNFGVDLIAKSESDSASFSNGSMVVLDVQSTDTKVFADLIASVPSTNFDIQIGWGEMNIFFSTSNNEFGHLHIDSALLGSLDTVNSKICINASMQGRDGGSQIRGIFEDFLEYRDIKIKLAGTIRRRLAPSDVALVDCGLGLNRIIFDGRPGFIPHRKSQGFLHISGSELLSLKDMLLRDVVNITFMNIGLAVKLPLITFDIVTPTSTLVTVVVESPILGNVSDTIGIPSELTFTSWENMWNVAEKYAIDQQSVNLALVGDVTSNFFSAIIPKFSFTLDPTSLYENANDDSTFLSYNSFDMFHATFDLWSDESVAELTGQFNFINNRSIIFHWDDIHLEFWTLGVSDVELMCVVDLSGATVGNGPGNVNLSVTFSGSANPGIIKGISRGNDLEFSLRGTIGYPAVNNVYSDMYVPNIFLKMNNLYKKRDIKKNSMKEQFGVKYAEIMGSNESPGGNINLPCLFNALCKNLVRDLPAPSILIDMIALIPDLPGFQFTLRNDIGMDIGSNGFNLGIVKIKSPVIIKRNIREMKTRIYTAFTNSEKVRTLLTNLINGHDTTMHVKGIPKINYLSKMFSEYTFDFDIDFENDVLNSNSPPLSVSLADTTKTSMTVTIVAPINNPSQTKFCLGTAKIMAKYGHVDGVPDSVVEFNTKDLCVNPGLTNLHATAKIFYTKNNERSERLMNEMISKYVWQHELPLELTGSFYPINQDIKIGVESALTIPKQVSESSFVKSFSINYKDTIIDTILNPSSISMSAKKVVQNSLSWPVIVTFFDYQIYLHDTDGVLDSCSPFYVKCICSIRVTDFCYQPLGKPTNVGRVQAGDEYGGKSIVTEVDDSDTKLNKLMPGDAGAVQIKLNMNTEMAVRTYEEFRNDHLCANIMNGRVKMAMQGDSCLSNDCIFSATIFFNWKNYPMAGKDSCGEQLLIPDTCSGVWNAPTNLDFVSKDSSLPGMVMESVKGKSVWSNFKVNVKQSWRMSFRITSYLERSYFSGDGVALVLMNDGKTAGPAIKYTSYKGIKNSTAFMFKSYPCDDFVVGRDGIVNSEDSLFKSTSLIGRQWRKSDKNKPQIIDVEILHLSDSNRAKVFVSDKGAMDRPRMVSFDLNIQAQQGLENGEAWIGFTAIEQDAASNAFKVKNIAFGTVQTDGLKTILKDNIKSPRQGENGEVSFYSRESCGRKKNVGNDIFEILIKDEDGAIISKSKDVLYVPEGGHYIGRFIAPTRGRYVLYAELKSQDDVIAKRNTPCIKGCLSQLSPFFVRDSL